MNSLTIIGNLVRDPELRTTTAGKSVCNFTVAVNRRQKDKDGNTVADFFDVAAWNEQGEHCAKYLTKGKKVCVIGSVSVRAWESKNGTHGASLEVSAKEVEFLTPRSENQQPEAQQTQLDEKSGMQIVETDELPY